MRVKKILIFGGSFDPPHKFHIDIMKKALSKINPDLTLIVPTYISPFKKRHLFEYTERKKMIKILTKDIKSRIKIYDFEYRMKRRTYTWMLVKYLKRKYKTSILYFLIGSDSYQTLHLWKRYRYLLKNLVFIVAEREGYEIKNKFIKDIKLIKLKGKFKNISSSQIRTEIFSGNFNNIPYAVRRYVKKRFSYITELLEKVKKITSSKRWKHIIQTVKLSLHLAWIYGADIKKTFLAAVLHDCAKELPYETQIKMVKNSSLKIKKFNQIIKHAPQIIHQWASRVMAEKKFSIKDKAVLSAISKHTTGAKKMSIIDRIIYVSDFSSYDRKFSEAEMVRNIAFKDLNKALKISRKIKIKYLKRRKEYIYET